MEGLMLQAAPGCGDLALPHQAAYASWASGAEHATLEVLELMRVAMRRFGRTTLQESRAKLRCRLLCVTVRSGAS